MAIVRMNKFTLLAFESGKEELLERLQAFSNVELINLQDEKLIKSNEIFQNLIKDEIHPEVAEWEHKLSEAKYAMKFLEGYVSKQSFIKSLSEEKVSLTTMQLETKFLTSNWEELCEKIRLKDVTLYELENERAKLKSRVRMLQPYESFNASLGSLKELKQVSYFLGSVPNKYEENLISDLSDCYIEIISNNKQDIYFIALLNKEKTEKITKVLRSCEFSPLKTDEVDAPLKVIREYNERIFHIESEQFIIKEELVGYDEELKTLQLVCEYYGNLIERKSANSKFLKTNKTTLIQGWVPVKENEKLTQIIHEVLNDDYYLQFEDVKEDEIDDVPIKLNNNDLNASFEPITEMYGLPKYNSVDPTPFITPFYLIFFGMMVADIGYGLIMFIIAAFLTLNFNLEEKKRKMVKFFFYLSIPTVLFGLIYGSFFGDLIKFNGLIDTKNEAMAILVISVIFGVIQIFCGLGIKAIILVSIGKPLEALTDVGSWVITLVSFIGFVLSSVYDISILNVISILGMVAGSIAIVLTQGRQAKTKVGQIAKGVYKLYGITSYLSDIVSYTRLMAIGLAGGSIASAINMIMKMVPGAGRFIAIPLIFLLGHVMNFGLSLLGAYVHSLRLTYVEYFSKFYDGGGRAFEPFKSKNQYINLTRD